MSERVKNNKFLIGLCGLAGGLACYFLYNFLGYISALILNALNIYLGSLQIIISGILTALMILLFFYRLFGKEFLKDAGISVFKPLETVSGAICGLALNILTVSLVKIISLPQQWVEENQKSVAFVSSGPFWMIVFATWIVAPFVEELIFRGVMFCGMKKGWHYLISGLISSVLFGLVHGNILQGIYAAVVGMALAVIVELTGSLWCSVAGHLAYNMGNILVEVLIEILSVQGTLIAGIILTVGGFSLIAICKIFERKK